MQKFCLWRTEIALSRHCEALPTGRQALPTGRQVPVGKGRSQ